MRGKKGLTLVELIVAVAFTAVIIAAAVSAFYYASHTFQSGTATAVNQQKAALAESYFQRYGATAFALSPTEEQQKDGVFFSISAKKLSIVHQTVASGVKTRETVAAIDGISAIEISQVNRVLNYRIISADGAYTLSGGVVLNNVQAGNLQESLQNGETLFFQLVSS